MSRSAASVVLNRDFPTQEPRLPEHHFRNRLLLNTSRFRAVSHPDRTVLTMTIITFDESSSTMPEWVNPNHPAMALRDDCTQALRDIEELTERVKVVLERVRAVRARVDDAMAGVPDGAFEPMSVAVGGWALHDALAGLSDLTDPDNVR